MSEHDIARIEAKLDRVVDMMQAQREECAARKVRGEQLVDRVGSLEETRRVGIKTLLGLVTGASGGTAIVVEVLRNLF